MRIDDPATLRAFLRRHGLDPNKGLGQHFLVSSTVVDRIVGACEGCRSILEIGPGPGVLTGPLSERFRVVAIELDARAPELLAESAPTATVVQGDALVVDWEALLADLEPPIALVSNMPYYISAPLLQRAASVAGRIDRAVLMMQREVGVRISAAAEKRERGSLSVYLQAVFAISKVADVPPGAFLPPPKVESVVLRFDPRGAALDESIFAFIQAAFAQPRKTLANNLVATGRLAREQVAHAIESTRLAPTVRPHELTWDQWRSLWATLQA